MTRTLDLPPINPARLAVARGRPRHRDGLVVMHRDEIAARLAALDWAQRFDFSKEAQREGVQLLAYPFDKRDYPRIPEVNRDEWADAICRSF